MILFMSTITIQKKEYEMLLKRQKTVEHELDIVRQLLTNEQGDDRINAKMLKHWDAISRNVEAGKGRSFASVREVRAWLKKV